MIYPWQEKQWQQLSHSFFQNRLSHAYLLLGISGLGKTDFARMFSTLILCDDADESARDSNRAICGSCKGCRLMNAHTHPDFILIEPHEKGHAIKIDQIRALTQQLTQKAQRGGYQVVVISPADAMPVGAANALLKTLEEPPGKVVLLLVASNSNQLPATITSRCQQLHFSIENKNIALDWLKENVKTEHDLSVLLSLANGAPLRVPILIDNDVFTLRNDIIAHLQGILMRQANPIAPIPAWIKSDNQLLFSLLITIGADLSRIQLGVFEELIHSDCLNALQKIAALLSISQLQQWLQQLLDKNRLVSSGINLNTQLMFEDLMIAISQQATEAA